MVEHRLTVAPTPEGWAIDGELDHHNAASLRLWCDRAEVAHERCILELAGLEILDSEGISTAIDVVRHLLQGTRLLVIAHPPHHLAHTLYRIGLLDAGGGRLQLFEPRQEEPYG